MRSRHKIGLRAAGITALLLALCGCQGIRSGTSATTQTASGVGLSAASIGFGNQMVGQTSAANTLTVTNTGTAPLTLTGMASTGADSGDFASTNDCGSSLAVAASCTVTVTFTPKAAGARSASITFTDNASGSPQTVSLTGTGIAPGIALSTTSLSFGNEAITQTSSASIVTVTNTGTAALTLSGIAETGANTGDFAQSNSCGGTLAAAASCSLSVTFTPSATGARSASITITDNAPGSPQAVSLTGTGITPATLQSINHIVFMLQENRSFDTYFGQLPAYWAANGYPQITNGTTLDGMPVGASNPGYNGAPPVTAYHVQTVCTENLTPSWDESHLDFNLNNPTSSTATLDGFVYNAAKFAIDSGYTDTAGVRAMGYYDGTDLNYYYFMASNFATSDRWFSPALDRTQLNRMYLFAATSQGYAYPPGTNSSDNAALTVPTIFDALQAAGVSWKIYATDMDCGADSSTQVPCTYLTQFAKYSTGTLPANVVSAAQFLTDAQNGQLPSVALIEGGYTSGWDEHPDNNVQTGAAYVETLINGFMNSASWSDSVFIFSYDEAGGLYDHVSPQPAVNPDGIMPVDLVPGDICDPLPSGSNNCEFNSTGFRIPMIVISPFTKKNYVSHQVADYTAILKLIETRFNLPPLTQRDAAQIDMSQEFFDFQTIPWAVPPGNVPTQATGGACNDQQLQ
jgi:phospholipase C